MLVFNVLDYGVPTTIHEIRTFADPRNHSPAFIVNLVSVARCVDDVEPQPDAIFDNDYGELSTRVVAYTDQYSP